MKKRVYNIVKSVAGNLRQELGEGARLVFFIFEPFSGELVTCWPRTDLPRLSQGSLDLMALCFKRERSILIHSPADPLMHSLGQIDFGAALCVPLADSTRNVVGVIYIDHQRAGAFDNEQRLVVERLARGMSASFKLVSLAGPVVQPAAPPPMASRSGLAAGLVALGFLGFWAMAPADAPASKKAEVAPKVPASWVSDPLAVMNSFNHLVALRELDESWKLLHPDLQRSVPLEAFKTIVSTWLNDEGRRWELTRRSPTQGAAGSTEETTCYLSAPEGREDLDAWEWKLVRYQNQWRIAEMHGGPLDALATNSP